MRSTGNSPLHIIFDFVKSINSISKVTRNKKLKNKFIYDFTTLIYVYNDVVKSDTLKQKRFQNLKNLIDNRFYKNIEYFKDNNLIISSFDYMKKIVDIVSSM